MAKGKAIQIWIPAELVYKLELFKKVKGLTPGDWLRQELSKMVIHRAPWEKQRLKEIVRDIGEKIAWVRRYYSTQWGNSSWMPEGSKSWTEMLEGDKGELFKEFEEMKENEDLEGLEDLLGRKDEWFPPGKEYRRG